MVRADCPAGAGGDRLVVDDVVRLPGASLLQGGDGRGGGVLRVGHGSKHSARLRFVVENYSVRLMGGWPRRFEAVGGDRSTSPAGRSHTSQDRRGWSSTVRWR